MGEITKIETFVIEKVKEMRLSRGLTQIVLSQRLNMSDSFVGHVESSRRRDKYNINHLNSLAKIFKCSIKEFFPEKPL